MKLHPELDSARQPPTDRYRYAYIHPHPLPPIPESRQAANEDTISHTPPSRIALQTTLPSKQLCPPTMTLLGDSTPLPTPRASQYSATPGGMLDQHCLIGGPYPQTFAVSPYSGPIGTPGGMLDPHISPPKVPTIRFSPPRRTDSRAPSGFRPVFKC
jgi:hypothetical protein